MRSCFKCGSTFEVQESHDLPCYLFIYNGNRKGRKNQADKFGRHLLCKKCHEKYEKDLNEQLKIIAIKISQRWFNDTY